MFCIHAATEYHLGLLKAKLAKYRAQLIEAPKGGAGAKVIILLHTPNKQRPAGLTTFDPFLFIIEE